jgi:uncharacterized protein
MKVVIDTNAFISILPSTSKFNFLFWKWIEKEFIIILSNDIYYEYEEILDLKLNKNVSKIFFQLIFEMDNVEFIVPNYKWNLISVDLDDNKFVDCAIAANADFIVTNDKHFSILKSIEFPNVQVITLEEFANLITQ